MTYLGDNPVSEPTPQPETEGRPLSDLRLVRAVAYISIGPQCEVIELNRPEPEVEIHVPLNPKAKTDGHKTDNDPDDNVQKRHPGLSLVVRENVHPFAFQPFVSADQTVSRLHERIPTLLHPRAVDIAEVTKHRANNGDGYIRLKLIRTGFRANIAERDKVIQEVYGFAEEMGVPRLTPPNVPLRPITMAFVPGHLHVDVLEQTRRLINQLLPTTILLDGAHQPKT
jgi:hypothetical protein